MLWFNRRSLFQIGLATLVLTLSGCHSAYVDTTVSNQTPGAITLVQVDYPSASFGTQSIAPGQDLKYRFKILGTGQMKLTYTDAAQREHKSAGPTLSEGTEGALRIVVTDSGVQWQPILTAR